MPADRVPLLIGLSTVLDGTGAGRVELGPQSSAGPANWHVTGVIVQTSRPGTAPIPRVQVYRDEVAPANAIGLSYDGSFAQGASDETLSRGSKLICLWSGGQAGDIASLTIGGEKW